MGTSGVHHSVLPRSAAKRQRDVRRMGHTSLSEMGVHDESLWARVAHLSPKLRRGSKISARQGGIKERWARTGSRNDLAPACSTYPLSPNCLRLTVG